MKRESIVPTVAWLGGAAAFFLRNVELLRGYDAQTRLMTPCVQTWALWALTAVLLIVLAAICLRAPGGRPSGGQSGGAGSFYLALNATAAFLLMGAGALGLWQESRAYVKNPLAILAYAVCLLAGGAVIATAAQVAHDRRSARFPILLMVPSFATLLLLIARYQRYAKQPVLSLCIWQLLAQVAAVLALYVMVSLAMGRGNAARVAVMSAWAIVLTLTSLGDARIGGIDAATALTDAFAVLYLSGQAWLMLRAEPEQSPLKQNDPEENDDE